MATPSYPIFLNLERLCVLIVGFGKVGQRKLAMLLPCSPKLVRIVDPARASGEGAELLDSARQKVSLQYLARRFEDADLEGAALVFAASSDNALNTRVAGLCAEHGILCNCASTPSAGTFHVPAVARTDTLTLALSTEQASPALSRRWKRELQDYLLAREPMARLMGRLRPLVLALGLPADEDAKLFRSLCEGPLEAALARNDRADALRILQRLLPKSLHSHIPELL